MSGPHPGGGSVLRPQGAFSLDAARAFLQGFPPVTAKGADAGPGDHLHLAFADDGTSRSVGACVRSADGSILVDAPASAASQVSRILSLDVDATGYADVGRADPVVGRLQARFPGLRPVLFPSPWEAAAWAVLSQRVQLSQAAAVKRRLSEVVSGLVDVHGEQLAPFPGPAALLAAPELPGVPAVKAGRLRSLAEAALQGALDTERLRSVPEQEAVDRLRGLPGIGPFSAGLVLVRGAGVADHLPLAERRLRAMVADAYGLEGPPSDERLAAVAERWRPWRSWVAFLLRQAA